MHIYIYQWSHSTKQPMGGRWEYDNEAFFQSTSLLSWCHGKLDLNFFSKAKNEDECKVRMYLQKSESSCSSGWLTEVPTLLVNIRLDLPTGRFDHCQELIRVQLWVDSATSTVYDKKINELWCGFFLAFLKEKKLDIRANILDKFLRYFFSICYGVLWRSSFYPFLRDLHFFKRISGCHFHVSMIQLLGYFLIAYN